MSNLIETLSDFTSNSNCASMHNAYLKKKAFKYNCIMEKFLTARMDDVRARMAEELGEQILAITEIKELSYFRKSILKREVSGDISYQLQRDHAAHTIYNYILGWYIFEKSPIVKKNIIGHFKKRNSSIPMRDFFCLWPFVSLLHDIGYLFEGNIAPLDIDVQSENIRRGAIIVKDFFNHGFWITSNINSIYDKEKLIEFAKLRSIEILTGPISEIADSLRNIGEMEFLRLQLIDKLKRNNSHKRLSALFIPGDAFDFWELHYKYFKMYSMAKRIRSLKLVFEKNLLMGDDNTGIKFLDHGICSGLLILLNSIYYYDSYYRILRSRPKNEYDKQLRKRFIGRTSAPVSYPIEWWWEGIAWGTAATALHNVQQNKQDWKYIKYPGALKITEDPLTYLGILVDCIQEWDRYSISREPSVVGKIPLQGTEVRLSCQKGKLILEFKDAFYTKKVKNALDDALIGWNRIIKIRTIK
jgi:hypothetical protein